MERLAAAARRSLELDCRPDADAPPPDKYTGEDRPSFRQRQHFQARFGGGALGFWGGLRIRGSDYWYSARRRLGPTFLPLTRPRLLQAAVLGALSVMLVDRACRVPFIRLEPACSTLFELWCAHLGCVQTPLHCLLATPICAARFGAAA